MLKNLQTRISYYGEATTDRIVNSKHRNLLLALQRSPQSYEMYDVSNEDNVFRGLITPSKLNQDEDQKMLSVDYDTNVKVGTVLHLTQSNTDWLVKYEHVEEMAYFRGEIARCSISLTLSDGSIVKGVKRSPVETTTPVTQKQNVQFEEMNSTVKLIFPLVSEEMFSILDRGKVIRLAEELTNIKKDNPEEGTSLIHYENYKIIARDAMVNGSIIEVYGKEYYEDIVEKIEELPPEKHEDESQRTFPYIKGQEIVNAYDTDLIYTIQNNSGGTWSVSDTKVAKIVSSNGEKCSIDILAGKKSTFYLKYTSIEGEGYILKIAVQSL